MPILRRLKVTALQAFDQLGVLSLVGSSEWRRRRLLILCYHGVSLEDEHEWSGNHVSEAHLRRRFEILKEKPFNVLPLGEALERQARDDLPSGSVVLTFDEGLYDFRAKVLPLLQEFQLPATLYVATYYTAFQRPIFDLASSYFLWRARGREINLQALLGEPNLVHIPEEREARAALHLRIRSTVNARDHSAAEKDAMLAQLCEQLDIDWEAFVASRMFQLMSPEELAGIDRRYVDVQLHTHRHRTPRERELFVREIDDNVAALTAMGFPADRLLHFCYPSGDADPIFFSWLEARGIRSATTCEPQVVTPDTYRFELPRVIDTMTMTEAEFRSWASAVSSILPARKRSWSGDPKP